MRLVPTLLSTTCLTAALICAAPNVYANPVGGVVSAGQAAITSSGSTLDVTQQTDRAVIDWRTFNIGSGETTQFIQPTSGSITLNRVNSGGASQINGNLTANGNIVIINQNGVVFGQGARVDVNGLIATTADTDNNTFMNGGNLILNKPGNPDASIINNGQITAKQAGLIGFVAPNVINSGVITAKLGTVHLASGDTATIDMYGDSLMEVAVSDNVKSQLVSNTGTIKANGGKIALTAAAGSQIVNSLINVQGTLQAQSIRQHNGQIIIAAAGSNAVADNVSSQKGIKQGSSSVVVQGKLDASGKRKGEQGGAITVTADNVSILNGSVIDASGDIGGGVIQLGGDFHGQGTTPTALNTYVDSNTFIYANAITSGNGGDVTVWADSKTAFAGIIEAMGGAKGGNGGFVETSGKQVLYASGTVNASAPLGNAGSWLLDPDNATISNSSTSNPGYSTNWSVGSGGGNISIGDILSSLDQGTSVTVNASGSITVANNIQEQNYNGTVGLTLSAGTDIILNTISINAANYSRLNLALNAGGDIYSTNSGIYTAGGNLTFGAPVILSGSNSFNAGGGTMTFSGAVDGPGGMTVNAGTFSFASALGGNTALGALSITSASTLSLPVINASSITLAANNGNYDIDATGTLTATSGDINIGAGNNINLNNVSGAGNVSINAVHNITVGNVTDGASGSLYIDAANNDANNGNGILTLNGNFTLGSGTFQLLGGRDNYGNRSNVSLGITQLGSDIGQVNLIGLNDVTILNNISTNTNFSTGSNLYDFTAQDITANGSFYAYANHNLTLGNITTNATGGVFLAAAAQNLNNQGLLTMNGNINSGTGNIYIVSGVDGSGNRATDSFAINAVNGSVGGVDIEGFQQVTLTSNLVSNNNIILNNDANFITQDLTAATDINTFIYNNLTVGNVTSGAVNGISLIAAAQNTNQQGLLTINGNLSIGTGALTLFSGVDGSGNRSNASFGITEQASSVGRVTINGFNNLTLTSNITSSDSININAITGTLTTQSLSAVNGISNFISGNVVVNGDLSVGSNAGIFFVAAGQNTNQQGLFTLNGNITMGSGDLNLISGVDGSGNRANISFGLTESTGNMHSINLAGFQDIDLLSDLTTTQFIGLNAGRDLTTQNITSTGGSINLSSGRNIATQDLNANGAIFVYNAGNVTVGNLTTDINDGVNISAGNNNHQGTLTLNGTITAGTGDISLGTGVDGSGNAPDLNFNLTNLSSNGAGNITLNGFNNVTFADDVVSSKFISIGNSGNFTAQNITAPNGIYDYAGANITVGNVTTTGGGGIDLEAGNNAGTNHTGIIAINGNLTMGSGNLTLDSSVDGSGNRANASFGVTADNSAINNVTINGFQNLTLTNNLVSQGYVSINNSGNFTAQDITATNGINIYSSQNLTVGNVTADSYIQLYAANNNTNALGLLTVNGNIDAGTSNVALISGVDGSGNRGNASFAMNNVGGPLNQVTINGFQNLTLLSNIVASNDIDISASGALSLESLSGNNINLGANSIGLNGTAGTTRTFTASSGYINMYAPLNIGNLNLTLVADNLGNSNINSITSASSGAGRILTVSPYSTGGAVGVADNANCGGGCNLYLNNNFLNRISSNFASLVLGSASDTGTMDIRSYSFSDPVTFLSGTGTINDNSTQALTSNTTFTNSGTINFNNAIDGDYNLTVSGNTLNFASALGANTALNNVSLTSANSLTLPSVNAATILAQTTGASSDITIPTGQVLTATGSNTALTLASAHNFINDAGSGALSAMSGRWLVYSTDPTHDTQGGLAPNFVQYNATYGTTSVAQNTGNGFLYTLAPTITVTLIGTVEKTYDQTTTATLTSGNYSVSSTINGDTIVINKPTAGTYDTANAGNGKTVSSTVSITSASNGSETVYGYQLTSATATGTVGIIDPKQITASLTGTVEKTYDQTTGATLATGNYNLAGVFSGDTVTLNDPTSGTYNNANAGSGKTVSVSGLSISGTSANNYQLSATTASGTVGLIDPKQITASLTGTVEKTYDQTTAATLASGNYSLTGVINGDTVTLNDPTSGSYNNANAGTGKTVSVSGLNLGGTSSGNYVLASTSTSGTVGIIDPKQITASLTGTVEKTYDQTTGATLATGNYNLAGVFSGDTVTLNDPTSGTYNNANAGSGKTVSVSGLSISGTSANNYQLSATTASGTVGLIDPKQITASLTGTVEKTYDQTTAATLATGNYHLIGVYSGDTVNVGTTVGTYDNANAGTGKTVSVSGLNLIGSASGNYYLASSSANAAIGIIDPKQVTASLTGTVQKIYDQTTSAMLSITNYALTGILNGDNVNLTNMPSVGYYGNANVGTGKFVYVPGLSLTGSSASNYQLTSPYAHGFIGTIAPLPVAPVTAVVPDSVLRAAQTQIVPLPIYTVTLNTTFNPPATTSSVSSVTTAPASGSTPTAPSDPTSNDVPRALPVNSTGSNKSRKTSHGMLEIDPALARELNL